MSPSLWRRMEDVYICLCNAVRQSDIERAIDKGVTTLAGLEEVLEVNINCGCCEQEVIQILKIKTQGDV